MVELIYIIVIAIIAILFSAIYFIQKKKTPPEESDPPVEPVPEINNVEIIPNNKKTDNCSVIIKWTCKKIPKIEFMIRYKIDSQEEWIEQKTSEYEQELTKLVKGGYYLFEIQSILEDRKSPIFRKKYYFTKSALNSNQQLAVSHAYSLPLMVIAGPGTGKTFVILERIKDLILNQGIPPERILCLTFNKNAQMEMSKRIQEDSDLKNQGKNIIQNIKTYNAYGQQYISKRVDNKQIGKWLKNKIENTEFKNIQNSFDSQEDFIGKLGSVIGAFRKEEITPEKLLTLESRKNLPNNLIYKVVFREDDLVERIDGQPFELQDYYTHPENYRSKFEQYLPSISMLINCVYWDPKYPRLVAKKAVKKLYASGRPKLTVIGDISIDVEGSIECALKPATIEKPIYVYDPETETISDGHDKEGLLMMAVDILPAELPRDASESFGDVLINFIKPIAEADFNKTYDDLNLPRAIKKGLILLNGKLTPEYKYLEHYLQ